MSRIPIFMLIAALLASFYAVYLKVRTESRNHAVSLTADYDAVVDFSGLNEMEALLMQLKSKGVNSVAINEESLQSCIANGLIAVSMDAKGTPLLLVSPKAPTNVANALQALPKADSATAGAILYFNGGSLMYIKPSIKTLTSMTFGIDPDKVAKVSQLGLEPIARLSNPPNTDYQQIQKKLESVKDMGIDLVIFAADEVLGARKVIKETAQLMMSLNIVYGSIEFGKQVGDAAMVQEMPTNTIRVHSVTKAEMAALSPASIVERYAKAVKERNVRLCYIHFYSDAAVMPNQEDNAALIGSIADAIRREGYVIAKAHPFSEPGAPAWLYLIIGLGAGAALWGWLEFLFKLQPACRFGLLILTVIIALACISDLGRQANALLAALIIPAWGLTSAARNQNGKPYTTALLVFIRVCLISSAGGLIIAGLLSDASYFVKAKQFMGIKAAHALPLLVVGIILLAEWDGAKRFKDGWATLCKTVSSPVLWAQAVLALLLIGMLGFIVIRTGNDAPTGVSNLELKARSVMDSVLPVRPRTKELLGHPVLILAVGLAATRRKKYLPLLTVIGGIGQVSIVNTFCHLHTPLTVSAARVLTGSVVGAVEGLILLWIVLKLMEKSDCERQKTEQ